MRVRSSSSVSKRSIQSEVLLECLVELLNAAVGLGLVVVGRAVADGEVIHLGLVVRRAKARAAVIAQRQAIGDGLLD